MALSAEMQEKLRAAVLADYEEDQKAQQEEARFVRDLDPEMYEAMVAEGMLTPLEESESPKPPSAE